MHVQGLYIDRGGCALSACAAFVAVLCHVCGTTPLTDRRQPRMCRSPTAANRYTETAHHTLHPRPAHDATHYRVTGSRRSPSRSPSVVRQLRHFGPFITCSSAPPPPNTHHTPHTPRGIGVPIAHGYGTLIGACNLMLCPIHVFRPVPVPPGRLNDSTPAVHRIWVQPRFLRARRCSHHRKREPGSAEPKLRPHVPAAAARGRRARSDGGLLARARLSVCRRGVRQLQRYFGPLLTSFQALSTPKRVFTRPPHASWNILYVATHTDTDWVLIWC